MNAQTRADLVLYLRCIGLNDERCAKIMGFVGPPDGVAVTQLCSERGERIDRMAEAIADLEAENRELHASKGVPVAQN